MTDILRYYRINHPRVAFALMQPAYQQLWYLAGDTIVFVLCDGEGRVSKLTKIIHGMPHDHMVTWKWANQKFYLMWCSPFCQIPVCLLSQHFDSQLLGLVWHVGVVWAKWLAAGSLLLMVCLHRIQGNSNFVKAIPKGFEHSVLLLATSRFFGGIPISLMENQFPMD